MQIWLGVWKKMVDRITTIHRWRYLLRSMYSHLTQICHNWNWNSWLSLRCSSSDHSQELIFQQRGKSDRICCQVVSCLKNHTCQPEDQNYQFDQITVWQRDTSPRHHHNHPSCPEPGWWGVVGRQASNPLRTCHLWFQLSLLSLDQWAPRLTYTWRPWSVLSSNCRVVGLILDLISLHTNGQDTKAKSPLSRVK